MASRPSLSLPMCLSRPQRLSSALGLPEAGSSDVSSEPLRSWCRILRGRGTQPPQVQQHRPQRIFNFVRGQRETATVTGEHIFEV